MAVCARAIRPSSRANAARSVFFIRRNDSPMPVDPVAPGDEEPHPDARPRDGPLARRRRTGDARHPEDDEKGDQRPQRPLPRPVERARRPQVDPASPTPSARASTATVSATEFHMPRPKYGGPAQIGMSGRCTKASRNQWLTTASPNTTAAARCLRNRKYADPRTSPATVEPHQAVADRIVIEVHRRHRRRARARSGSARRRASARKNNRSAHPTARKSRPSESAGAAFLPANAEAEVSEEHILRAGKSLRRLGAGGQRGGGLDLVPRAAYPEQEMVPPRVKTSERRRGGAPGGDWFPRHGVARSAAPSWPRLQPGPAFVTGATYAAEQVPQPRWPWRISMATASRTPPPSTAATRPPTVLVFLGNADGTFQWRIATGGTGPDDAPAIVAGDFDAGSTVETSPRAFRRRRRDASWRRRRHVQPPGFLAGAPSRSTGSRRPNSTATATPTSSRGKQPGRLGSARKRRRGSSLGHVPTFNADAIVAGDLDHDGPADLVSVGGGNALDPPAPGDGKFGFPVSLHVGPQLRTGIWPA